MGGQIGCQRCTPCNNCAATAAVYGGDRCASCLGGEGAASVLLSYNAAHEPGDAHKYQVAGADCPSVHPVCGDFGVPSSSAIAVELEEPPCFKGESIDQVLPLDIFHSHGVVLPNIGSRQNIATLEEDSLFNPGKLLKIRRLAQVYGHWRPVRGDGNCFYRTVAFGALEAFLAAGDKARMRKMANALDEVLYDEPAEQTAHALMMGRLRSWDSLAQLEHWIAQDVLADQALIRACRRLVRLFLVGRAHQKLPIGLTYAELARGLDVTHTSVEEFCSRVVDPMGRDAETLALEALPRQLGVGLRLWILDRRDEVALVHLDTPGPDGEVDVHLLFKPGHYDLLYPRR
mmetsp:Transcript_4560/g.10644  ORF Transcript_4560/g.10644 Transcript_4560/m.10644 type:complete len:345 (+) Transcript_4560:49-1083(+)